jgi:hypothetical protein
MKQTNKQANTKKIGINLRSIVRVNVIPRVITNEIRLKLSLRSHGVSVEVFDKSNSLVNKFPNMANVALHFCVSGKTISRYLDKNKSYNGYTFKSNLKRYIIIYCNRLKPNK